jgi:hypothetical protein
MLFEKPASCPLCNGSWMPTHTSEQFTCANWKACGLLLMDTGSSYYVKKICPDGTEIWWSSVGPCEVRRPMGGFFKITFVPPFDITPEQIKLYVVFS